MLSDQTKYLEAHAEEDDVIPVILLRVRDTILGKVMRGLSH